MSTEQALGQQPQPRTCYRCFEPFGDGSHCEECGVSRDRIARRMRRTTKIGGKHGRNSGKVSQHGKTG